MDAFAKLPSQERRLFFEQTGAARNITPQIVEKDFWVCWTLKEIFGLPEIGQNLIFKGGTSLSKIFKVIERFSEDIDVSIDRAFLGFGGSNEPEAGGSKKERQRRIEALRTACQVKIAGALMPALDAAIRAKVSPDEAWSLFPDKADPDGQTLLFAYPQSFPTSEAGYIRKEVKIEMGARADHWPCETMSIMPFVAEEFAQKIPHGSCEIKVLAIERTFWEKATILHAEYHRPAEKQMPDRFSRHYCDFYELIHRGIGAKALTKIALLDRVAQHKTLFFRSSWAKYDEAVRGTLRIVPPEHRLKALSDDYQKMEEMFFGKPPSFKEMMQELGRWETEFNQTTLG